MPNEKLKLHPIHNLFKFNAESRESKCIVSNCRVSLKGKHVSSLIRHAKGKHRQEYLDLMAVHKKHEAQPNTTKEGMQLRSHCEEVVKEKKATKRKRSKEKSRLYSKEYRERMKLKKIQTEDKPMESSVPTSLMEGLSMSLLRSPTLDPLVPVCPIPMTLSTKRKKSTSRLTTSSLVASINNLSVNSDRQCQAIAPVPRGTGIVEVDGNHHVPTSKDEAMPFFIEKLQEQQLPCIVQKPICSKPLTYGIVEGHSLSNVSWSKSQKTLAENSQQQPQATALDSQQYQTVYPNRQETNGISDLVDNVSSETNNNSNFSSATIPLPSPCSLLKVMSDIIVLLEPNQLEARETPSEVRIEDLPPLVPIDESFHEVSFPSDYAPVETFFQPYPANIPIEDYSLQSSTEVVLSPEAQIMLSEQMRKHVQLLTQMHLITAQQSDLKSVTEGCHSMLQNLVPLKQRMEIANLDEALDLVNRWETVVTKASSEELSKYQRQVVNCGEKKKFLKCSRKNLERFPFNPKMVEMMAESRVFIYPELLPTLAIFQAERGPCRMSPHEDQLIAMGIERFTPFYEDYFSGSQKSMSFLICSMISQFMLPHRTAKEIEARIKSKCLPTSPANPIKYYLENKVAPSVHHVIQPFDRYSARKLSEIPSFLLPSRWRELFSFSNTVDTLQYQLPEQNISRIPQNTSTETHIARIPLNCPEVCQKRFVPASTSRKLKSPSKYEKILGKPQMATTVRTRDQRRHKTISKKRRFVHPHEVEVDLEEIFIENIKSEFDKGEN